jgi:CRISPR-associated protein Csx14
MSNKASIPVDLFNPGQVFACLGFLEGADVLHGNAEGGFDWSDDGNVTFALSAKGERNPFATVLTFLAAAKVEVISPKDVVGPWPERSIPSAIFPAPLRELLKSNKKSYVANALPLAITDGKHTLSISNWLEGDGRIALKLFGGNQAGAQLASIVLNGQGDAVGLKQLLPIIESDNFQRPFDVTGPVGGRFGYDARGAWDAIRLGTSLDKQGMLIKVSPHVEIRAALGLEYARPEFRGNYEICYSVWGQVLPIALARVALTAAHVLLPRDRYRAFRAHPGDDQQYKKCFSAQEEPAHDQAHGRYTEFMDR